MCIWCYFIGQHVYYVYCFSQKPVNVYIVLLNNHHFPSGIKVFFSFSKFDKINANFNLLSLNVQGIRTFEKCKALLAHGSAFASGLLYIDGYF